MTSYGLDDRVVLTESRIFPAHHPAKWVSRAKRLGLEGDHSPRTCGSQTVDLYIHPPPIRLHGLVLTSVLFYIPNKH
jgi:hypothetical protein